MSTKTHIAHASIGIAKYPLDDPRNAEVVNSLEKLYSDAETTDGFVWRKQDEEIFGVLAALGQAPNVLLSLSVWTDVDALRRYTFSGLHKEFMDRSSEWFETMEKPTLVLWPVAAGEHPKVAEALERLEHLKQHGPSAHAYGWDGPDGG